jgi:hypothetical protein
MSMTLKIDLSGVKALVRSVNHLKTIESEVGFFPEDTYGADNDNLPVAAVADWQQRGVGNYPKRPFFNDVVINNKGKGTRKQLARHLKKVLLAALQGQSKVALLQALTNASEFLKEAVKVSIRDYPGSNSSDWAEFKGKNDPLSYTDTMLNAVKFRIKR